MPSLLPSASVRCSLQDNKKLRLIAPSRSQQEHPCGIGDQGCGGLFETGRMIENRPRIEFEATAPTIAAPGQPAGPAVLASKKPTAYGSQRAWRFCAIGSKLNHDQEGRGWRSARH